jgi:hypothetical protein
MTSASPVSQGQPMRALSIPQDASLEAPAQAERNLGKTRTAEEEARANFDAVFELACRFILIKALPGWIEEICTEHLQSAQPFSQALRNLDRSRLPQEHNADTSVWKKTQATLDDRHQASDQKIDV